MSFRVIHKDDARRTALVQPVNGGRSIPVVMADWLRNMVCVGDWATVTQSPITGELVLSDFVHEVEP